MSHKEAVRLAREKLPAATTQELAAYIEANFGLRIKPAIVTVLLGSLQEREELDRCGQAAREQFEQWKADHPEEAKKLAEGAKRRAAIRSRKAGTAVGGKQSDEAVKGTTAGAPDAASEMP